MLIPHDIIHSSAHGHLCCFYFMTIINNAMKFVCKFLCGTHIFIPLRYVATLSLLSFSSLPWKILIRVFTRLVEEQDFNKKKWKAYNYVFQISWNSYFVLKIHLYTLPSNDPNTCLEIGVTEKETQNPTLRISKIPAGVPRVLLSECKVFHLRADRLICQN